MESKMKHMLNKMSAEEINDLSDSTKIILETIEKLIFTGKSYIKNQPSTLRFVTNDEIAKEIFPVWELDSTGSFIEIPTVVKEGYIICTLPTLLKNNQGETKTNLYIMKGDVKEDVDNLKNWYGDDILDRLRNNVPRGGALSCLKKVPVHVLEVDEHICWLLKAIGFVDKSAIWYDIDTPAIITPHWNSDKLMNVLPGYWLADAGHVIDKTLQTTYDLMEDILDSVKEQRDEVLKNIFKLHETYGNSRLPEYVPELQELQCFNNNSTESCYMKMK